MSRRQRYSADVLVTVRDSVMPPEDIARTVAGFVRAKGMLRCPTHESVTARLATAEERDSRVRAAELALEAARAEVARLTAALEQTELSVDPREVRVGDLLTAVVLPRDLGVITYPLPQRVLEVRDDRFRVEHRGPTEHWLYAENVGSVIVRRPVA